jgi:hypothetical protein
VSVIEESRLTPKDVIQREGAVSMARRLVGYVPETVIVIAALTYALLWRFGIGDPQSDTGGYLAVAADLSDGRLDTLHFRAPGYGVLMLVTGSLQTPTPALFFVQLGLYIAAVYLVVNLLRRLELHPAGVVMASLVLVLPPWVEHVTEAMSETVVGFFLVLGLSLLLRGGTASAAACGVAVAAAALTRPAYQALGLGLGLALVMSGAVRRGLAVATVSTTIVLAFCIFNQARFGYFGISPALGLNLSTRTVRVVERLPPSSIREILIEERNRSLIEDPSHTALMYVWGARDRLRAQTGYSMPELERHMLHLNLELIAAAPMEYLADVGRAACTYWFPAFGSPTIGGSRVRQGIWIAVHFAVVGAFAVGLVVVTGAMLAHGLRTPRFMLVAYALLCVTIFYSMAVSSLVEVGNPRYRVPTDALIVAATAIALSIWQTERSGRAHPSIAEARPSR